MEGIDRTARVVFRADIEDFAFYMPLSKLEQDRAVPIDGAVIRQRVWPAFRNSIPTHERPESWDGDGFNAYGRYMTAIVTWSNSKGWSTSEVERTISLQFQPDWNKFCA